jgi:glycine cleavage system H protein
LRATKFAKTHEWVRQTEANTFRVGISKFAQEQLGEVVFVDLPKESSQFNRNAVFATLESVKAVGEAYCPFSEAKVVSVNSALKEKPNLINSDPEGEGWIAEFSAAEVPSDLLDAEAYQKSLAH